MAVYRQNQCGCAHTSLNKCDHSSGVTLNIFINITIVNLNKKQKKVFKQVLCKSVTGALSYNHRNTHDHCSSPPPCGDPVISRAQLLARSPANAFANCIK